MSEFGHLFITLEEASKIIAIDLRGLATKLTPFIYVKAFLPPDREDWSIGNKISFYSRRIRRSSLRY